MKFFALVSLAIFGTTIMLYAVIEHEPPAFLAFVFGIITGVFWSGIFGLHWLRQNLEDYDHD